MIVLVLGFCMIISGGLFISFPDLVKALKAKDEQRWFSLGSPPEHAFTKSLGVFSWVLDHGFERSASKEVMVLGARAYKKALTAKYLFLTGIIVLMIGFALALLGA